MPTARLFCLFCNFFYFAVFKINNFSFCLPFHSPTAIYLPTAPWLLPSCAPFISISPWLKYKFPPLKETIKFFEEFKLNLNVQQHNSSAFLAMSFIVIQYFTWGHGPFCWYLKISKSQLMEMAPTLFPNVFYLSPVISTVIFLNSTLQMFWNYIFSSYPQLKIHLD